MRVATTEFLFADSSFVSRLRVRALPGDTHDGPRWPLLVPFAPHAPTSLGSWRCRIRVFGCGFAGYNHNPTKTQLAIGVCAAGALFGVNGGN